MHDSTGASAQTAQSLEDDGRVFWDTSNPAGYANRSGHYKTRVEREFIHAHFPPPPARVLDIAGGSGRFAIPLIEAGYELAVNDLHASSLARLCDRCGDTPPRTFPGSFLSADISGPFDCALAMECLDQMPFAEVLARLGEFLAPGGTLICTVLNSRSWRFAARALLGRAQKGEFVFSLDEYRRMCAEAGFEIVAMRGMMWTLLPVTSNSPLVPVCAQMEQSLRLYTWYAQSPWLLMAIRKTETTAEP
jgi:2-polyprenyl-3-methyl-5-hydroxy-6-metoxy-1,4-benzoquinol methylase